MSENDYPPNKGQSDTDAEDTVELTEEDAAPEDAVPKEEEIANLNDRILRLAAELENTRRRAEREKADAGRYAIANFARDLLGVADNFERALQAADAASDDGLAGLIDGLRMTEKELLTVFERHGVRRVSPAGQRFDPNLHQAVAQVPHPTIPSGNVVDVAQPGFTIGDRVLRAAMVTVSSGGGAEEEGQSGGHLDTEV